MTYTTSRRRFLVNLGISAAVGATTPIWYDLLGRPFAFAAAEGDLLPNGTPICVHIALEGGNDYLNTLVPVEDGFYKSSTVGHGAIALNEAETLALAGTTYRLHEGLGWLANRWNTTGDVGFVLGVGNTKRNFSHFDSLKYWETARADVQGRTGWLGRYSDLTDPRSPFGSVSIADLRRDAIGALAPTLVVQKIADFAYEAPPLNGSVFLNSARQMATLTGTSKAAEVARMMGRTFAITGRIQGAADPAITDGSDSYAWVTTQLLQCALLIRSGLPSQSYTLGFGNFDSHTAQRSMQTARFNELNEGLTKFFAALAGHPRQNDVFVLITSEFGRQGTVNKDLGTDHGQAGMAIFVGGGVTRGVYGQAPTLDPGGPTAPNRVHDALKPTVDFRSVHATALNRLAKGDANVADEALGAHHEDFGLFAQPAPPTTTTSTSTTTTTTTTTIAPNQRPVARFSLSSSRIRVLSSITANGSASTDPDGTIAKWQWNWGDGTASATGKSASHRYVKRGTFTVKLVVTDNRGATATTSKTVRVT